MGIGDVDQEFEFRSRGLILLSFYSTVPKPFEDRWFLVESEYRPDDA